MKKMSLIAALMALCSGCQTFVSSTGKKFRQFAPVRDRIPENVFDTTLYVKKSFSLADYKNENTIETDKRIIVSLYGKDVETLINSKEQYYLYFWNATCAGTQDDIYKLDSLAQKGNQILIVSLRRNYDAIHTNLAGTKFVRYPYYVIEDSNYTNLLAGRRILFIKEACKSCYEQYADELQYVKYLLIDNGKIEPVFHSSEQNILK